MVVNHLYLWGQPLRELKPTTTVRQGRLYKDETAILLLVVVCVSLPRKIAESNFARLYPAMLVRPIPTYTCTLSEHHIDCRLHVLIDI